MENWKIGQLKRVTSHVAYLLEQIGVTVKQINPQEIVKLARKLIMITMLIIMTIGMDSCLKIVNTAGHTHLGTVNIPKQ